MKYVKCYNHDSHNFLFVPLHKVNTIAEPFDLYRQTAETYSITTDDGRYFLTAECINPDFDKRLDFPIENPTLPLCVYDYDDLVSDSKQRIEALLKNVQKERAMELTIEDLDFSVRTFNSLKRWSEHATLADLVNAKESDLLKVRNMGRKSIEEVKHRLAQYGYTMRKE